MFNYGNLSDVEFEELCKDIMENRLNTHLHTYARGRDGGIDICDLPEAPNVMIQVKHYFFSGFSALKSSLKKEKTKVEARNPGKYYICTSAGLTPKNVKEIYEMFSDYMKSSDCILSREDIDDDLSGTKGMKHLTKFPKLGITIDMINEILNRDAAIDGEVLFSDMEKDSKRFVATGAYYKAMDVLSKKRTVILTGKPGCGKTMTSRMLAMNMAEKGYRIIFVSNHDIRETKALISQDKDAKELIFLDDCFGQRYFELRQETEPELAALMRYVQLNNNKYLLMNSRVTVYREAQSQYGRLKESIMNDELDEVCIDVNNITEIEKAQILYNHLFFAPAPAEIMEQVRKDYNYRKIACHKNYNPRIISNITRKRVFMEKQTTYIQYVFDLLENPNEIWEDEYKMRLKAEDRIFLNTLFSLTDMEVLAEIHKRAYYSRIRMENIDISSDPWSASRNRLIDGMLKVVEKDGREYLAAADPSVNDYLESYLKINEGEVTQILSSATENEQFTRLNPRLLEDKIRDGSILDIHFRDEGSRKKCILTGIVSLEIKKIVYKNIIKDFYAKPFVLCKDSGGTEWICRVYMTLLKPEYDEIYDTREMVSSDSIEYLLQMISFEDYPGFFRSVKQFGQEWILDEYEDVITDRLIDELICYLESADLLDFFDDNPGEILSSYTNAEEIGPVTDYEGAAQEVLENAISNLQDETEDILYECPEPFNNIVCVSEYVSKHQNFTLDGAESILYSALEPDCDEMYDEYRQNRMERSDSLAEIDRIFHQR